MSGRSGVIALAGRPNVGKSTLANALSGRHVAAVSPRAQTTRRRITAVVHGDDWQAVLLDLPGFQKPGDGLTARMQATVDHALADVDAALFVLNAQERIGSGDRLIAGRLAAAETPTVVVLNKVDVVDAARIARVITEAADLVPFRALHPVSARTGEGVAELRAELAGLLPNGPPYFPSDVHTDQTEQELAGELIREAALVRLREEVPHALAVEIEMMEELGAGVRIAADLIVETESQKRIVVGKGGSMVGAIGSAARARLGHLWGEEVHLALLVKVRRRWRDDQGMLDRLGV